MGRKLSASELREVIDRLLEEGRQERQRLAHEQAMLVPDLRKRIVAAINEAGYQPCEMCQGFGTFDRIDASYMRRFGLQSWEGCTRCGGSESIEGRGYYSQ